AIVRPVDVRSAPRTHPHRGPGLGRRRGLPPGRARRRGGRRQDEAEGPVAAPEGDRGRGRDARGDGAPRGARGGRDRGGAGGAARRDRVLVRRPPGRGPRPLPQARPLLPPRLPGRRRARPRPRGGGGAVGAGRGGRGAAGVRERAAGGGAGADRGGGAVNPGGRTGIHSVRSPPPLAMSRRRSPTARVALAQGLYYAATGVWPFLSMRTFLAVTGPKVDLWLVKTVGGLVGVVGGALLAAGARGRVPEEMQGLAVGSAAFLAGVDAVYAAKG